MVEAGFGGLTQDLDVFETRRNGIKLPQPVRKKPDNHQQ